MLKLVRVLTVVLLFICYSVHSKREGPDIIFEPFDHMDTDTLDSKTISITSRKFRPDADLQVIYRDSQEIANCRRINSSSQRFLIRSNYTVKYYWQMQYNFYVIEDTMTSLFDTMPEKISAKEMSRDLSFLVSPFSGLEFGTGCGEAGAATLNNYLFEQFLPQIDSANLWILMCARNPITRINAAIFYLNNKGKPFEKRDLIEFMIRRLNLHPYKVRFCSGCTDNRARYASEILGEQVHD
jgi:hypothetical protein